MNDGAKLHLILYISSTKLLKIDCINTFLHRFNYLYMGFIPSTVSFLATCTLYKLIHGDDEHNDEHYNKQ